MNRDVRESWPRSSTRAALMLLTAFFLLPLVGCFSGVDYDVIGDTFTCKSHLPGPLFSEDLGEQKAGVDGDIAKLNELLEKHKK